MILRDKCAVLYLYFLLIIIHFTNNISIVLRYRLTDILLCLRPIVAQQLRVAILLHLILATLLATTKGTCSLLFGLAGPLAA